MSSGELGLRSFTRTEERKRNAFTEDTGAAQWTVGADRTRLATGIDWWRASLLAEAAIQMSRMGMSIAMGYEAGLERYWTGFQGIRNVRKETNASDSQ